MIALEVARSQRGEMLTRVEIEYRSNYLFLTMTNSTPLSINTSLSLMVKERE